MQRNLGNMFKKSPLKSVSGVGISSQELEAQRMAYISNAIKEFGLAPD